MNLIKSIKEKIAKRSAEAQIKAYEDGYNFASENLLSGKLTPAKLESYSTDAIFHNTYSKFDEGIKDAINAAVKFKLVDDDRY